MSEQEIINKTASFVKATLTDAEGGHDWSHIERVWKNTKLILQEENANALVCELAALLHDIADSKFHNGDETIGPRIAKEYLQTLELEQDTITHIVNIIENMSFKASLAVTKFHSKEMEIVQDADKLDAIGAIGIARTFNYGGFKNRKIYDPTILPETKIDKETYKKIKRPQSIISTKNCSY